MRTALRSLERFLLPNQCVACEQLVSASRPDVLLCTVCRARLQPLVGGCARCHQPLPPVGPCRFCAEWPEGLRWVCSAVWLGDEARALLHHLKYQRYAALAEVAADTIIRSLGQRPTGLLCPIPLGRRRLGRRGYNQAAVIAQALARRWNLPLAPGALTRVRETRSQTALDAVQRRRNVAGAFVAAPPPAALRQERQERQARCARREASIPVSPASSASDGVVRGGVAAPGRGGGAAVILVDDVLTTGATVAAAAAAVEAAGWHTIGAVTFARALPFVRRAVL